MAVGEARDRTAVALEAVEAWLFDLDNTLYPASCDLFAQIDRRMQRFIEETLDLDPATARQTQKRFFQQHGTTLRGLMDHHGIDPDIYLDYVHDIELDALSPNPALDAAIAALPGRKLIFTNASAAHASRVTERLGITAHFEAVFDIVAADYRPKPNPTIYARLVENHGLEPSRTVFIEDSARNLAPAAALGMTTVWLAGDTRWAGNGHEADFVHHVIEDLTDWLLGLGEGARRSGHEDGGGSGAR
ncbi:MAG: pyrimidine 5'-nucleotidase [Kiloniellales bacterium]|nr:pyrimidine 5'-nucleotidase [Kiloniellales bacterium]